MPNCCVTTRASVTLLWNLKSSDQSTMLRSKTLHECVSVVSVAACGKLREINDEGIQTVFCCALYFGAAVDRRLGPLPLNRVVCAFLQSGKREGSVPILCRCPSGRAARLPSSEATRQADSPVVLLPYCGTVAA